jgi:predicted NAD-dependent protein-ADP-ribosyltransferase YbiA (DUF1768 family)
MVKSLIDKAIEYKETTEIESDDSGYEANIYESEFFDVDVVFAIGQVKYTYLDNKIVYYPIYLIGDDNEKTQIGVYELLSSEQQNIVDEDGDVDLNRLNLPLFYSNAYSIISSGAGTAETVEESESDDDSVTIIEKPQGKGTSTQGTQGTQGKSASTQGKSKKSVKQVQWIKDFMEDANYNVIDTPPDGNCFFTVLKLALEERGQTKSVDDLREILANNMDQSTFDNYKVLYDDAAREQKTLTLEIKNITKRHNELEKSVKTKTKDRNLQISYVKQLDEMETKHKELKDSRAKLSGYMTEFAFMKGIDNLAMLKLKMKTRDYWADTWAISTLERELNIKVIILSEYNYLVKDTINVLQCGQLNDTILEKKGIFEPSFFVITCYQGIHYQIITYNEKQSFTFGELPEKVKDLVVDKCLEKMAGPYSLIPDFVEYKKKRKQKMRSESDEDEDDDDVIIVDDDDKGKGDDEDTAKEMSELPSDLYDNSTVFRFYIKSADKPLPGKGSGEKIGPEGVMAYKDLAKIPEWRKKLSNSWLSEFILDRHRWQSVEHYYQASKYKTSNPEFYLKFSLDTPDSDIARDPALAKEVGEHKTGMFKGVQMRPKNIKPAADFFAKTKEAPEMTRSEIEMENAMRAKFDQNPELKRLLIETKRAKLEHVLPRREAVVFNELMRIRRDLQRQQTA